MIYKFPLTILGLICFINRKTYFKNPLKLENKPNYYILEESKYYLPSSIFWHKTWINRTVTYTNRTINIVQTEHILIDLMFMLQQVQTLFIFGIIFFATSKSRLFCLLSKVKIKVKGWMVQTNQVIGNDFAKVSLRVICIKVTFKFSMEKIILESGYDIELEI